MEYKVTNKITHEVHSRLSKAEAMRITNIGSMSGFQRYRSGELTHKVWQIEYDENEDMPCSLPRELLNKWEQVHTLAQLIKSGAAHIERGRDGKRYTVIS